MAVDPRLIAERMREIKRAADDKATAASKAAGLTKAEATMCNVATMMMVRQLGHTINAVGFSGEKERVVADIIAEALHDAVKSMSVMYAAASEEEIGEACEVYDRQAAGEK